MHQHPITVRRPARAAPPGAVLCLACLVLASLPAVAQDLSNVEITSTQLADGVWMLQGAGGNLGVSAGADGVFLIDDQYAPLTEKIVAAIAKIAPETPIRFVLNTHWHGDHTGGNENLGERGALIVAHENVRERMSVDQFLEAMNRTVEASPAGALPVVTFTDAVTFHLNGDAIHAVHVAPAHTDGDAFVHFREADVIHAGDLFFNGMYPFIDLSSGGSLDGIIAAAERMLELTRPETKVIPGHGPLATRADLEKYRTMLVGVRDAVAPMVAAGKSLEEIQAADPLAPWNEVWGGGFMGPERFLGIAVESLQKGNG